MIYKALKTGGDAPYADGFRWSLPVDDTPGEWMSYVEQLVLCESGYHLCDGEKQLLEWLNAEIYEAEYRGEAVDNGDKIVVHEARLVRRIETWNDRTARLFACACAERALPHYESEHPGETSVRDCIATSRRFARGYATRAELAAALSAARAAAWDAAWDVASTAAWVAAWDAALSAARAAAWDAARAAASTAAWVAAWDAAWVAEREWQAGLLGRLLRGEWDGGDA